VLYLFDVCVQILERQTVTKEEELSLYRWISCLCRHQLMTRTGRTILHLCVDDLFNQYSHYRVVDTRQYLQYVVSLLTYVGKVVGQMSNSVGAFPRDVDQPNCSLSKNIFTRKIFDPRYLVEITNSKSVSHHR
jgi:hypothetical protein